MSTILKSSRLRLRIAAVSATLIAVGFRMDAQKAPSGPSSDRSLTAPKSVRSTAAATHVRDIGETIALLPWTYRNGKDAAMQSAREVCNQLLLQTGFNVYLIRSEAGAMPPAMPLNAPNKREASPFAHLLDDGRALVGQTITGPTSEAYILPTVDQMAALGEKLRTRYVLAGRAQWSTRNVWVGIANRAKSICTVDVLMLDMDTHRLVLDSRNVEGDSTENKNMFNTVTSVVALNPLPLVLPGSVTPQEQRAVTVATAKALEPWLRPERIRTALAQADISSEGATDTDLKFTNLLRSPTELKMEIHASVDDPREMAAIDPDLARLYTRHSVALEYSAPGRLRLRAANDKGVQEVLSVDDDSRRFTTGDKKQGAARDVSNVPDRNLSLLDPCGILTAGMLDTMRARYVRRETIANLQTVVYDLTYWRGEPGAYQRLWIDPEKRLVARREVFDRNGKLTAVYLYHEPVKAGGLWLPARVEIQNASHKRIALLTTSSPKASDEVSDAP